MTSRMVPIPGLCLTSDNLASIVLHEPDYHHGQHKAKPISLAPLALPGARFCRVQFIWLGVEQSQGSQRQLEVQMQSTAQPLLMIGRPILDSRCKLGIVRLLQTYAGPSDSSIYIRRFTHLSCMVPGDISVLVRKVASSPFLKFLFTEDDRNVRNRIPL